MYFFFGWFSNLFPIDGTIQLALFASTNLKTSLSFSYSFLYVRMWQTPAGVNIWRQLSVQSIFQIWHRMIIQSESVSISNLVRFILFNASEPLQKAFKISTQGFRIMLFISHFLVSWNILIETDQIMHRQIRIFVENFMSRMSLSITKNYSGEIWYRIREFRIRFFESLVFLWVRRDQNHFIIDIIISEKMHASEFWIYQCYLQ